MHACPRLFPLAGVLLTVALVAGCHEEGNIKVTSLKFQGNKAIAASRLQEALATKTSGRFPWSAKRYFDRTQFEADLKRLAAFYADRGYPHARVTKVNV